MQGTYTCRQQDLIDDRDLGFGAMIIAEDDFGNYEPIETASTMGQAKKLIASDYASRLGRVAAGQSPMQPARYVVWINGPDGYRKALIEEEF